MPRKTRNNPATAEPPAAPKDDFFTGVLKLGNEYASSFGHQYARTPKAVFAAIAWSLALRLNEDDPIQAYNECMNEWRILHQNGIVPQKPPTGI